MDLYTTIENEILNVLSGIDGTVQLNGYTYYTDTGTVTIYDEALSLATNRTTSGSNYKSVNHIVEQQEDNGIEFTEWTTGQWAYNERVMYTITSRVHNVGTEGNPKNAIKQRMNEVLSDLVYAFGRNYQLGGKVSWIRCMNAYRQYEDVTNNRIQTGSLITQWEVEFQQSINNPNNPACW